MLPLALLLLLPGGGGSFGGAPPGMPSGWILCLFCGLLPTALETPSIRLLIAALAVALAVSTVAVAVAVAAAAAAATAAEVVSSPAPPPPPCRCCAAREDAPPLRRGLLLLRLQVPRRRTCSERSVADEVPELMDGRLEVLLVDASPTASDMASQWCKSVHRPMTATAPNCAHTNEQPHGVQGQPSRR